MKTGKTPVLQPAEARLLLDTIEEKGGKHHAVPVHHKAEAYLDAAGIAAEKDAPLWRSMPRASGMGARRMSRVDVFRMIKRRVKTVGLGEANCHTFRATGITAYLLNGGTLERAQAIAAHESPRTQALRPDRRRDDHRGYRESWLSTSFR